ncbi:MAG: dihydroneopterin aldolase [Alphaproteobacteria bacterium]
MSSSQIIPFQLDQLEQGSTPQREIMIKNALFETAIGAYSEEKGRTQTVRLNLVLWTDDIPPIQDELSEVVCYDMIMKDIRMRMSKGHTQLIETLLEDICSLCLKHQGINQVQARLEKLEPIAEAESVSVLITRKK